MVTPPARHTTELVNRSKYLFQITHLSTTTTRLASTATLETGHPDEPKTALTEALKESDFRTTVDAIRQNVDLILTA